MTLKSVACFVFWYWDGFRLLLLVIGLVLGCIWLAFYHLCQTNLATLLLCWLNEWLVYLLLVFHRQVKAALEQTSPLSPTSSLTGTTYSFRPPSRYMKLYGQTPAIPTAALQEPFQHSFWVSGFSFVFSSIALWNRYPGCDRKWGYRNIKGLLHYSG